jgi:hypothetical protein
MASYSKHPEQMHPGEFRASANLPPLTRTDIFGIAVAVIGTAACIMLAATTANGDAGTYGFVSAGRILIAIGISLINLAHVVGIFLFESVDYHGTYQKFFARMSLFGTIGAVVLSVAIGIF